MKQHAPTLTSVDSYVLVNWSGWSVLVAPDSNSLSVMWNANRSF